MQDEKCELVLKNDDFKSIGISTNLAFNVGDDVEEGQPPRAKKEKQKMDGSQTQKHVVHNSL